MNINNKNIAISILVQVMFSCGVENVAFCASDFFEKFKAAQQNNANSVNTTTNVNPSVNNNNGGAGATPPPQINLDGSVTTPQTLPQQPAAATGASPAAAAAAVPGSSVNSVGTGKEGDPTSASSANSASAGGGVTTISWRTQILIDAIIERVQELPEVKLPDLSRSPGSKAVQGSPGKSGNPRGAKTAAPFNVSAEDAAIEADLEKAKSILRNARRTVQATHRIDKSSLLDAAKILRPRMDQLPRSGLYLLVGVESLLGERTRVMKVLEILVTQKQEDFYAHYQYGLYAERINQLDLAIEHYKEARRIKKDFLPVHDGLFRIALSEGRQSDALQLLEDMQSLAKNKISPRLNKDLCLLYTQMSYLDKAQQTCQLRVQNNAKDDLGTVLLALVLYDKESPAEAETYLNQSAQNFPHSYVVQIAAGELALERKRSTAALRYFRKASDLLPQSIRAQLGHAQAALQEGEYAESLKAYESICRLNQKNRRSLSSGPSGVGVMGEMRKSLAYLRRQRETSWAIKFETSINICGGNMD